MLMGLKLRAYPTSAQKQVLSQWMGAARVVWNAKCEEWNYESRFAQRYLPIGTYATVDQKYSQYKDDELTPYLSEIPSQILRNSATNWNSTMHRWMKGLCKPAKKKKKGSKASVHLTNELFSFVPDEFGHLKLILGTKTNPVGELKCKFHRGFAVPKSIHVAKKNGIWTVSFCYDDGLDESTLASNQERLEAFRSQSDDTLEACVIGVDRGVRIAAYTSDGPMDFSARDKEKQKRREKQLARYQRRMARQQKGSNRRAKIKYKTAKLHTKNAQVRQNFCHQTSHALTKELGKVIVLENLKTAHMTKSPKPKKDEHTGKWQRNGAAAKAGLNRSILRVGWHTLESMLRYKTFRRGSLLVKISPQFSSQECAECSHIHPHNRKDETFLCLACGHRDHADRNAARVLKKRAINLIRNSGTELSSEGVLFLNDIGRGATGKTSKAMPKKRGQRNVKKESVCKKQTPEACLL